ncbi:hypothetical protein [Flavilitoribacter nigricans]|uniref:MORN repeat variant n=1 Tax=Flavilitoribacter nigricans (strain ATCC 23147 / DSM 23189 / NBRC 102662 / NCIMB 1420 / SS-2) TaxID=1122177 RepID=A0A2D0NJD6_FLAN2|nr:hypothetical protein [Flavilitoribacter nigricans]PHN08476.1 hypothetical protein CRP01_00755 [Flavilitoribacter nigricans DSM 23189 = NBRC 102662]
MKTKSIDANFEFRNEYNRFNSVFYKGEPFSGTFEDGNESIQYKNGAAHGTYIIKFDNGNLQAKEEYEEGNCIGGEWYHENGKLSTKWSENFEYTRWNAEGILVQKKNVYYFQNGQISHIQNDQTIVYYSPEGDEVYRRGIGKTNEGKHIQNVEYNHLMMDKWFYELLKEVPCENSDGNRIHWIHRWTWEIFEKDQKRYFEIVSKLINHPNEKVRIHYCNLVALQKFVDYLEPENESNREAFRLIKANLEKHDKINPNRKTKEVNL